MWRHLPWWCSSWQHTKHGWLDHTRTSFFLKHAQVFYARKRNTKKCNSFAFVRRIPQLLSGFQPEISKNVKRIWWQQLYISFSQKIPTMKMELWNRTTKQQFCRQQQSETPLHRIYRKIAKDTALTLSRKCTRIHKQKRTCEIISNEL